ncbi:hypothetical protein IMG5_132330 [Ichthyophthirius multifiliis]|uniref:Uncharacterized protein n=1 Tax=Ichthyophthirius multifiliis TaxID=5932 RepID=G0QWH5_ICHMU|nr:hypothetical protein IMG5_132330 [Ichthyophthirius multifiliis]EGR30436.1 hypothetical protein IMG5_132330 [Ichthyophthirius multifiliis]|eukprot:XP_004032023.1 hypothetical protein IMG5_132330 [Ichthyophthirius multifiliis]
MQFISFIFQRLQSEYTTTSLIQLQISHSHLLYGLESQSSNFTHKRGFYLSQSYPSLHIQILPQSISAFISLHQTQIFEKGLQLHVQWHNLSFQTIRSEGIYNEEVHMSKQLVQQEEETLIQQEFSHVHQQFFQLLSHVGVIMGLAGGFFTEQIFEQIQFSQISKQFQPHLQQQLCTKQILLIQHSGIFYTPVMFQGTLSPGHQQKAQVQSIQPIFKSKYDYICKFQGHIGQQLVSFSTLVSILLHLHQQV